MLDFTSALYLGLQHSSRSLGHWRALTTGAPAALIEPMKARALAQGLAELQGCEAAILGTSTLHLAWDLFNVLAEKPIALFVDAGVYPITRWGVQRAAMRGATVSSFPHYDAVSLERTLAGVPPGRMPVIVTDGSCPRCGRVAPLSDYLTIARSRGGLLVVDDTQALGILGHSPGPRSPYGLGGGGSLRWSSSGGPEALVFSSLAKGFGAPLAVLAGNRRWIGKFEEKSLTRVHCSPPSIATLRAAERALICNHRDGEVRRARLLGSIRRFRRGLNEAGVTLGRGIFPIQMIRSARHVPAVTLHRRLAERGVRAVLNRGTGGQPRVSFLLTARHTPAEIDVATAAVRDAMPSLTSIPTQQETRHEQPIHH